LAPRPAADNDQLRFDACWGLPRFACYCHIPRSTKEYEHAKVEHAPRNISAGLHLKFAVPPAIATSAAGSKLRAPDQPKTKIDVVYGDVLISP
jgi:hypothetical protein